MSALDSILAILTGRKVKEGNLWRVYDAGGNELADAGGVLLQGLHGLLLNNQQALQLMASLGSSPRINRSLNKISEDEEINESVGHDFVSRIREEFLSSVLADDLIQRAKTRKSRAEEEALLLMF